MRSGPVQLLTASDLIHEPARARAADRFDQQAERFDRRAGLRPAVARDVAAAVVHTASVARGDVILEIGAGTGGIGCELAKRHAGYLGLDLSPSMLDVFRRKLSRDEPAPLLVVADANRRWPVRDGTIAVVFASRAAHLLDGEHLVAEARRVCRTGGYFLIGRVVREPNSLKSRLRDERLRLRSSARHSRRVDRFLEDRLGDGAAAVPPLTVATWTEVVTAERVIHEWEQMESDKLDFAALRAWARQEFGDLSRAESSSERYTLEGVRFGSIDKSATR